MKLFLGLLAAVAIIAPAAEAGGNHRHGHRTWP